MDIYWSFIATVFGLIIGSFLNCLIWRLYKQETLGGRSYCPGCRQAIAWFDNIPLLSWLHLKGKCRHCHMSISWQYPLVELATGISFWGLWQMHGLAVLLTPQAALWPLFRDILVVSSLVVVFVYDFRWQLVPVSFIWLMASAILVLNLYLGEPWLSLLLYGCVGAAFFLIQYILTRGRGVGEGDIWLGLLLGLSFPSWQSLFLIMLVSYSVGSIIGLGLIIFRRKNLKSAIALGPFLAIAGLVALFFGDKIINWYQGLLF